MKDYKLPNLSLKIPESYIDNINNLTHEVDESLEAARATGQARAEAVNSINDLKQLFIAEQAERKKAEKKTNKIAYVGIAIATLTLFATLYGLINQ